MMSTIEYRRCDYLGCIASVSADEDEHEKWGYVSVQVNEEDEPREPFDICPEHVEAMSKMLEGEGVDA